MQGAECGGCGCERCDVPEGDAALVAEAFEGASDDCDDCDDCGLAMDPAAWEAAERAQGVYESERLRAERHGASVEYRDAEVSYETDGLGRFVAILGALAFDDEGRPSRLTEEAFAAREGLSVEALRSDFAEYLRDRDSDLGDEYADRQLALTEAR